MQTGRQGCASCGRREWPQKPGAPVRAGLCWAASSCPQGHWALIGRGQAVFLQWEQVGVGQGSMSRLPTEGTGRGLPQCLPPRPAQLRRGHGRAQMPRDEHLVPGAGQPAGPVPKPGRGMLRPLSTRTELQGSPPGTLASPTSVAAVYIYKCDTEVRVYTHLFIKPYSLLCANCPNVKQ